MSETELEQAEKDNTGERNRERKTKMGECDRDIASTHSS